MRRVGRQSGSQPAACVKQATGIPSIYRTVEQTACAQTMQADNSSTADAQQLTGEDHKVVRRRLGKAVLHKELLRRQRQRAGQLVNCREKRGRAGQAVGGWACLAGGTSAWRSAAAGTQL